MPKIRRQNLPPALYAHLLDRVQQRNISAQQLRLVLRWMDTQPEVPSGRWFKRFPELIVCGEAELTEHFSGPAKHPRVKTSFDQSSCKNLVENPARALKLASTCRPN
jgi:hypothetical protein